MIITKEEIMKKENGELITLPLLIKDYTTATTKTGSPYFNGTGESKGQILFKVWSGELYDKMLNTSYRGKVINCTAKVNIYNGITSLVLEGVEESNVSATELQDTPYNSESLWGKLTGVLRKEMSDNAYGIYNTIMEDYEEDFKYEVAALKNHDNFVGGLLAHTYKMVVVLNFSLKMYKGIYEGIDTDLLYLAVALHDIGKVKEYSNGAPSEINFASHHITGVEIIATHKDLIISKFGEQWYYRLLSVITQHHGEWGEPPRTVEALIVHNIDYYESQMQLINQALPLTDKTQIGKFKVS